MQSHFWNKHRFWHQSYLIIEIFPSFIWGRPQHGSFYSIYPMGLNHSKALKDKRLSQQKGAKDGGEHYRNCHSSFTPSFSFQSWKKSFCASDIKAYFRSEAPGCSRHDSDSGRQWSLLWHSMVSAYHQERNICPGIPQQLRACSRHLFLWLGGGGSLMQQRSSSPGLFLVLCSNQTRGQLWAPRSEAKAQANQAN